MPDFDENPAYDRAIELMETDPEASLTSFAAASRAQPKRARIHANRALVLLDLGRTEEAREAAQTGWELDPEDGYVGTRLVHAMMDDGAVAEVAEVAERVLALELDDDDSRYVACARGWSLMRVSPTSAVAHGAEVVGRWPEDPEVAMMHACALAAACRWDDALQEVDRAIAADPEDARYLARRESIAQMRTLGLAQIAGCETQTQRAPEDADAWRTLGIVLARYGRAQPALSAFERAHALAPVDADEELEPLVRDALMIEATLAPMVALGLPTDPVG